MTDDTEVLMQTLQETPHQKWSADKSVFQMRDGNLYLTMSGMTFPMGGGAQSGFWSETVNISKHIEDIVRRVLSEKP